MKQSEMTEAMMERVAGRFRALGEPYRLRILQLLQSGEQSVGELVSALGGTQSNVSKHLSLLHSVGVVARRREGTSIIYAISDPMIFKLCDLVCGAERQRNRKALKDLA